MNLTCMRTLGMLLYLLPLMAVAGAPAAPLSVGIVANNEPYSSYGPNGLQGFSIDLLDELSRISGLDFEYRVGSWSEIYAAFLRGDLDAIDEISWRADRADRMLFTRPYHLRTTVIMHDASQPIESVSRLMDLEGYRVGVLRDIYYSHMLREAGLEVVEYDFQSDLVRALSFGWVDAVVGPEVTLRYMARQQGFVNLEVLAKAPLQGQESEDFRIAVSIDRPDLHQRLDDALASIDPDWIDAQRERWQEYGGQTLQPQGFKLSAAQRATLRQQGPIRVGLMRDYAPITFEDGGRVRGLSVDVLHRIMDMTGLQAIPVVDQWNVLMEQLQRGEIDVIANISDHPDRRSFTRFTAPYYQMPVVVFSRMPEFRFNRVDDFGHFRVGLGSDIFYEARLRARLGDQVSGFDSQASMFQALADGEVDLVLSSLPNGNHWIRALQLNDVYVAGELRLDGLAGEDLRFGLRPELAPLVPIFNQALAAMTPAERRAIENRWLGAHFLAQGDVGQITLSTDEQRWLGRRQQQLRYCIHPDRMPLEGLDEQGRHQGMSASLLRLFAERIQADFELHPTTSWAGALQALANGDCDLLPMAGRVPDAQGMLSFSDAYYTLPTIVLGRLEAPFITHLDELQARPIGILQDFALLGSLQRRYPGLNLVPVASEEEGVRRVQRGELYGYIGTLATTSQLLRELGYADVRVLGRVPMDTALAVASSGRDPELTGLIDKLVASLGSQDLQRLDSEWRTVELKQSMDYRYLWQILLATVAVVTFMVYWIRKLRALNRQLARANRQLEAVSTTDALTGLGNRVLYEQQFDACFQACQRNCIPFMVAVLDVDLFKAINDTYGHAAGDRCLQALSACMRRCFRRESDCLIRFGGEEFVIFHPASEPEAVSDTLEGLRAAVEAMTVTTDQGVIRMTISIGYCLQTPGRTDRSENWLKAADQAVYQVKRAGRNGVCGSGLVRDQARERTPV
ncbi:transporter substrate-binding domain-containing protein [Marinobacterium weihaiense]|uniref:Transporter substrate-binding domain-containing protein n=1 Tax=Marinobacterium weihaiense TaxID=2851016 RepID=A0ABS6M8Z2_9GAMM|nr:transporter substrate-binding domain-containing protein [Marinobacterium weihaiense]MBV0932359.1 transporter substrate-binding domain-containing protein [Marinobacterium weihaiense]